MKLTRACNWISLFALSAELAACIGGVHRGTPLYANGPLRPDEVATLIGPVTEVDGLKVHKGGKTFEVEPGCHLVQIGGTEGAMSPQYGGYVVSFPAAYFAFFMRAQHTYSIDFEKDATLGQASTGWGSIVARERDPQGGDRVLPRVSRLVDVPECR